MAKYTKLQNKKGHSLIELALVITIIGLISVTVMSGGTVLKQAKLRAVKDESERYMNAAYLYAINYGTWPGDTPNMSDTVPHSAACVKSTGGTGKLNGDGNGTIDFANKGAGAPAGTSESYLFFCHLKLTNTMPLDITYLADKSNVPVNGVNIPSSKIGGAYIPFADNHENYLYLLNASAADVPANYNGVMDTDAASALAYKYIANDDVTVGAVQILDPKGTGAGTNKCLTATKKVDQTKTGKVCVLRFVFPILDE